MMSIYVVSQKVWAKDCGANLEIIYMQNLLTCCVVSMPAKIFQGKSISKSILTLTHFMPLVSF